MEKRILIIDDSELVLAMAKAGLEQYNYSVQTATNGIEANRHIFSRQRPDLIIMDIMMPLLDGNKKARLLKDNEATASIPILLWSSKPDAEMTQLVQETGAEGYICKPFTPQELAQKVRMCLK